MNRLRLCIFFCLFLITPWLSQAGDIDSPAPPDDPAGAMFTLQAIFDRLNDGSEGTIRVDHGFTVYGGKRGDSGLAEIENPASMQASWRVEEEFANAIRGTEPITRTPFEVGLHYMEWTEAVTRSAQTGQAVSLPL